jgi:hypothetical protein
MRVSTENALSFALFCVAERALCYLRRQAQPSCVETVKVAGKPLVTCINPLQPQENQLSQVRDLEVLDRKAVELMAMDGQVPLAGVVPFILLVHAHADQVRHDLGQSMIMVAFHPDHLHVVFGIRKLADISQKSPVLLGEAAKIEVGKNIAQKDQPPELNRLQKLKRVRGPADLGTQVQVGDDHGVKALFLHAPLL